MKITNLIQNIGKCRNLLATKDFNTVLKNIYLFEKVYIDTKTQINKLIKNSNYQLDFTVEDLQELSDEIFQFVKNYQTKMTFNASLKELKKHKTIDNYLFRAFTKQQLDLMYLDRKLREAYKILSYCAITLWVLTEAEKQNELDWQVTETIKSFL